MNDIFRSQLSRRTALAGALGIALTATMFEEEALAASIQFSHILGRPTDSSIALSVLASAKTSVFVEFGYTETSLTNKSSKKTLVPNSPGVFEIVGLASNTKVYYRLRYKTTSAKSYGSGKIYSFSTAKSSGTQFAFTVQGDTHPERAGKMFNAALYTVAMKNITSQLPDFHILLGDDFSIDPLISKNQATKAKVEKIYLTHRKWLSIAGSSTPIFLVNGNHEQAAQYLLNGKSTSPAVLAGKARLKYFPLPINSDFYSTDSTVIPNLGNPRDYYSWNWGDATFITLDPYWHSKSAVDNVAGASSDKGGGKGSGKTGNLWQIGLGDVQYAWLKKILEESRSKFIFVFAHHVMGTGRGAVEVSYNYEWGGNDPTGKTSFKEQRPNWELPIHDLFVKHGVSIFFQGHDHIFVTQERDGLIYQSMPNPADDTFSMFNSDAYKSGTKAPNSGHVKVSVGPDLATVEYFLAARAQDSSRQNLSIAHSYSVKPRAGF